MGLLYALIRGETLAALAAGAATTDRAPTFAGPRIDHMQLFLLGIAERAAHRQTKLPAARAERKGIQSSAIASVRGRVSVVLHLRFTHMRSALGADTADVAGEVVPADMAMRAIIEPSTAVCFNSAVENDQP